MARRRRLTPARAGWLGDQGAAGRPMRGPDLGPDPAAPPIAQVAAEASAASALAEVAAAMAAARAEGRLVQRLALDAIAADHLLRDRIGIDEAALEGLIASIAAHGQRSPIEVAEIGPGRYGLISGWRRLTALARLQARTGEARFAGVLALVRAPGDAAEAYVAMVEENEIRLDLSHYERARIVARSVAAGVFPDTQTALRRLFAHGSRARRSKIGAFLGLVEALDGVLCHPAALGERLGLQLAQRLATEPGLADRLRAALAAPAADAAAEQAVIATVLGNRQGKVRPESPAPPAPPDPRAQTLREEPRPGVQLETGGGWLHPVLTLSGPAVDQGFKERLIAWLRDPR